VTSWIKKNSFSDATGNTYFSDTTSHTSPSGYVACRFFAKFHLTEKNELIKMTSND